MPLTNEYPITIPKGKICSWYATAQTASSKTIELYSPKNMLVFKTSINSRELDNFGIGSFTASEGGEYILKFPDSKDVKTTHAEIVSDSYATVCSTHIFGGEDAGDADYQDVFLTLTIYLKKG